MNNILILRCMSSISTEGKNFISERGREDRKIIVSGAPTTRNLTCTYGQNSSLKVKNVGIDPARLLPTTIVSVNYDAD
jgi:hypothetical protein